MFTADPALTDAELREAYKLCRGRTWADYPAEMADPTRRALVEACAAGRRRKQAQAHTRPVAPPAPICATPLPQQPLLKAWPPRRAEPEHFVDRKRAAAGDRDD